MRAGRHTGRILLLLIASAICALGSPKQHVQPGSSILQLRPQTGQSLALSDFDRDGTTDRARLGGGGSLKSVAIFLSGSGTFSTLTAPDESTQETADTGGSTSDQITNAVCPAPRSSTVVVRRQSPEFYWSTDGRNPSQRGPPPALV